MVEKIGVKMEEVEIIKPRLDKREYKRIVLKNSLQVLLISDPETDKSAASMDVFVGSFSDPDGLEGLAHFLEHMLFYASEKYPVEDSYSKYITENGGSTNAFTSSEQTNYHFDVNADCFEEALDRFAQFLIKPLMSADATTREIKAVDSENQNNLLSDGWRMNQLQKHMSSEVHPFNKFSTGNWDTLEVRPKARGVDTRLELLKFYKEYYSANIMCLAVYAKESLEEIEKLVLSKFEEIPNTNRSALSYYGQPCTSEHLEILVKAVPIREGHKVSIQWPIAPGIHHYKQGPSRYLGHLIGHEAEGSLYYSLKKLGWATSLYAGESDWTHEFSFFEVVIELTDAGHEHVEDIVALLFKYITLLQQSGVCKWIFDELSAISEMMFHYQDKTHPISYVVHIASNMQLYPPKDWLVGTSLLSEFSPDIIQSALNELTPHSFRIFWESTKFKGNTENTEPWYGTEYSVEKISESLIQQWMGKAPEEHLHLPTPNVFIPTDLSLKNIPEKALYPVVLRKSAYTKVWYKPDTMFSTPKAYVTLDITCSSAGKSPESSVLADIFTRLLMDYLNEYAYYAQVASLYYGVSETSYGIQVGVFGYNHKLRILLEKVIDKIANFEVKLDRFSVIKEMVIKEYQNIKFQQPHEQAMHYCSLMLRDQGFHWDEELEVLRSFEADDLVKFYNQMFSRTFIEFYITGNIDSDEAESIVDHIEEIFYKSPNSISKPLFPSQHLPCRIVKLEQGVNYFYSTLGLNPSDENSALIHYIQVHQENFLLNVKLQLFVLIAKQPAFHQLRSVEQLGYITMLTRTNDSGVRGLQFLIQSAVKGPRHIDLRVEAFLKMFETKLYEMSEDEFKRNVNSLIEMKLEKNKNLMEEASFYWWEISEGILKFDRKEQEVAALKQLTRKELIDFFNDHIKCGATEKKTLTVRVYGSLHSSEKETDESETNGNNFVQIDDIFTFRRSRPLYASFK